jgi:hypothetical protein
MVPKLVQMVVLCGMWAGLWNPRFAAGSSVFFALLLTHFVCQRNWHQVLQADVVMVDRLCRSQFRIIQSFVERRNPQ